MIVDTSAIIAILLDEPEKADFAYMLAEAGGAKLSAGSWIELAAVTTRRFDDSYSLKLHTVLDRARIQIAPLTAQQAQIGHDAYRTYGLGSGHRARLNFGDCFAYALAQDTGEPLLFKGDDFIHTDVKPAIA